MPRPQFRISKLLESTYWFAIAFALMRIAPLVDEPVRWLFILIGMLIVGANIGSLLGSRWGRVGALAGVLAGVMGFLAYLVYLLCLILLDV